jgi:hypothetical protein
MSFGIKAQITDTGNNVGIGVTNPSTKFHVASGSFGIKSQYSTAIIESTDTHLDLISSSDGIWGTSINLIEGNGTSNTDIWSIIRQTTNGLGNSSLRFNFGTSNNHFNSNKVTFNSNGNVGIGTTNPSSKLQLMNGNDGISFDSSNDWVGIGFNRSVKSGQIFDTSKSGWQFTARNDRFSLEGYNGAFSKLLNVLKNGNIGIGTINPGTWKLAVNGKIRAKEIKVETGWSDFVFYDNYRLPTLQEVEKHIKQKGHLKDIPSAKEVEKSGIFLGEMNAKLLQKIEELTLYTIEQEKKINNIAKDNKTLKTMNSKLIELQKRLEKLEKK